MSEEESFEQRPEWSERRVMCCGGHMALGWGASEKREWHSWAPVMYQTLFWRPWRQQWTRLLNISIVYCLTVQAVLYQYYISYLSLIAWFSEIENSHIGKVSFFSLTAYHFLLFSLGGEPIDFYYLEAPKTVGYWSRGQLCPYVLMVFRDVRKYLWFDLNCGRI